MNRPADLFDSGTAPDQLSLFGAGENRLAAPVQAMTPDPEHIRRRLRALLDTARAAETMPWAERDARMWRTVFPNMARWLPAAEADQLRLDFQREMKRLDARRP